VEDGARWVSRGEPAGNAPAAALPASFEPAFRLPWELVMNRYLVPVVLGLGLSLPGCRQEVSSGAPAGKAPVEPIRARAAKVTLQPWVREVRVQGSLLADEHVVIGAKVAGRVERVPVDVGTPVRKGEVLMRLETKDLDLKVKQAEAQLQQARAKLGLKPADKEESLDRNRLPAVREAKALWEQAKRNLKRAESLAPEKAISLEDLQQRQAAVEVGEALCDAALDNAAEQVATVGLRRAELDLARQARDDAEVRAPVDFDAVVDQRYVAPGAYVQVGQPVVSLVRVDPLRFHAGVPEREAVQARAGQEVRIQIEGRPEPIVAKVSRISPALDPSSRAVVIEADVPNPGFALRVGIFAEAEITVDPKAQAIAVPATAVQEFAGVEKVWLVRDGEAAEQAVQTGRRGADRVEILQGLAVGDLVLVDVRKGRRGPVIVETAQPAPGAANK